MKDILDLIFLKMTQNLLYNQAQNSFLHDTYLNKQYYKIHTYCLQTYIKNIHLLHKILGYYKALGYYDLQLTNYNYCIKQIGSCTIMQLYEPAKRVK